MEAGRLEHPWFIDPNKKVVNFDSGSFVEVSDLGEKNLSPDYVLKEYKLNPQKEEILFFPHQPHDLSVFEKAKIIKNRHEKYKQVFGDTFVLPTNIIIGDSTKSNLKDGCNSEATMFEIQKKCPHYTLDFPFVEWLELHKDKIEPIDLLSDVNRFVVVLDKVIKKAEQGEEVFDLSGKNVVVTKDFRIQIIDTNFIWDTEEVVGNKYKFARNNAIEKLKDLKWVMEQVLALFEE